jgi:sensor histidine kinase regulating citrate/malate metabolism
MNEMSQMRQTIEQTMQMYDQIRMLRHDISNHMMTMERLADRGRHLEAREYMTRLKEEYSAGVDGIRCGNPVIDTILSSKRDMAVKQELDFKCDFTFPGQPVIDVFDLSVLLNNALDNALRGVSGSRRWISISSISREEFFTIIIKNSFEGEEPEYDADGLPLSTKNDEGHGLGLKMIRHIALSYNGEMEFVRKDGEIELRVLLHNKDNSQ